MQAEKKQKEEEIKRQREEEEARQKKEEDTRKALVAQEKEVQAKFESIKMKFLVTKQLLNQNKISDPPLLKGLEENFCVTTGRSKP